MTKIKELLPNEEFVFQGYVFTAYLEDSKVKFKLLRKHDKKVKKGFDPPTLIEVKKYFEEKGYSSDAAKTAFDYYTELGWKDGNGKQILNWKAKMISVWFKEQNKIKKETSISNFKFQE